ERLEQDLDVERQRPGLYVEQVILGALDDRGLSAQAIDLRPAGHAGLFHMPLPISGDQVRELRYKLGPFRSWPHQAHFAKQHIDQLWKLVQAEATNDLAESRSPWVVWHRPDRP